MKRPFSDTQTSASGDGSMPCAEEAEAEVDSLTVAVGRRPPFRHKGFSDHSLANAAKFQPRPTDVFILTPPKVGTTWLQMLCHTLRLHGQPSDFEDIYQVSPWDQLAWDLGQDLDAEQVAQPRLFKTHLPLSTINHGAKYICVIRRVEDVLLSWWEFLKDKEVPVCCKYSSASEFAMDEDFFAGGMRFGASLWEYYVEFFQALNLPSVLVLCYEDLVLDVTSHLEVVSEFLGVDQGTAADVSSAEGSVFQRTADLCSREAMLAQISRFDESWAFEEAQRVGRIPNAEQLKPSPRIKPKVTREPLSEAAQELLSSKWKDIVAHKTGMKDYDHLRDAVKAEFAARRAARSVGLVS